MAWTAGDARAALCRMEWALPHAWPPRPVAPSAAPLSAPGCRWAESPEVRARAGRSPTQVASPRAGARCVPVLLVAERAIVARRPPRGRARRVRPLSRQPCVTGAVHQNRSTVPRTERATRMPRPSQTCAVAGCGFSAAKTRSTDVPFSHPAIVAGGSRDVVLSNRLADKPWAEYLPDHEELRDVRLADVPTGACIKCLLRHGVFVVWRHGGGDVDVFSAMPRVQGPIGRLNLGSTVCRGRGVPGAIKHAHMFGFSEQH